MNHSISSTILFFLFFTITVEAAEKHAPEPWRIHHITFSGNVTFKNYELLNIMEFKPKIFRKKPRFSSARLQSDILLLSNFYASQGFLSAVIQPVIAARDSIKKRVSIHLQVDEGKRTRITQLVFSGSYPDSAITSQLKCKKGDPLIQSNIIHDEQLLRNAGKNKGFLYTTVITRQSIDSMSYKAYLNYFIRNGPLIIADSIQVTGISGLKPQVVLRELTFSTGDTMREDILKKTERNLYRTALIKSVDIEPNIYDSNEINWKNGKIENRARKYPILVTIKESNFLKLKMGIGYGSYEGARGSVETSYSNLFHFGHRLAIKGNLSQLLQQAQTIYSTPWFLGIPLRFNGTLYYNRFNNEDTYKGGFRGVQLSLEKATDYKITLQFLSTFEDVVWIRSEELPDKYPIKNTQSFGMNIIFDNRNDLLDPSNGFYNLLKAQVAGIAGINSNQFIKITNDSRIYWNAGKLQFASGIKIGWVRPYDKSTIVPLQEQFYAGGSKSVRGFRENYLLSYSDSTLHAKSGNLMVTANMIEVRFPIIWLLNGALFVDAGYLTNRLDKSTLTAMPHDIRTSAGAGLRINTPLAIVRIDAGFKLDKKPGENLAHYHIDIGQSF